MRPETGWICVLPAPRHPIETRKERLLPKRNPRLVRARRAASPRAPNTLAARRGLRIRPRGRAAIKRAPPCACRGDRRPATLARLPSLSFLRSAFPRGLGRAWGLPPGQIRPEEPGPGGRTAGAVDPPTTSCRRRAARVVGARHRMALCLRRRAIPP